MEEDELWGAFKWQESRAQGTETRRIRDKENREEHTQSWIKRIVIRIGTQTHLAASRGLSSG